MKIQWPITVDCVRNLYGRICGQPTKCATISFDVIRKSAQNAAHKRIYLLRCIWFICCLYCVKRNMWRSLLFSSCFRSMTLFSYTPRRLMSQIKVDLFFAGCFSFSWVHLFTQFDWIGLQLKQHTNARDNPENEQNEPIVTMYGQPLKVRHTLA